MASTKTDDTPKDIVTATESAIVELRRLLESESEEVTGVRMAVKGGGCSGLSYVLDFDKKREGDNVVEHGGIDFYMDRKSTIYLKGIQLDYNIIVCDITFFTNFLHASVELTFSFI